MLSCRLRSVTSNNESSSMLKAVEKLEEYGTKLTDSRKIKKIENSAFQNIINNYFKKKKKDKKKESQHVTPGR